MKKEGKLREHLTCTPSHTEQNTASDVEFIYFQGKSKLPHFRVTYLYSSISCYTNIRPILTYIIMQASKI